MNESGRASWTAHLGDLPATVTGPAQWVRAQRDILGHFLAGPISDHELEPIRLDVTFDDHLVHLLTAAAEERPGARLLETTPGVVMVEYPDGPSRVLTIATDKIDDSPGTHALRITDEHIELVIHSNSNRTDRLPLRVLREAMIRRYENAGATLIHAAGGAFGSAGIAVCGPRAAGKTTTLAALLTLGADLLSNDRLLIPRSGAQDHDLVAVPLPVPIARGTVEAVEVLRAALATTRREGVDPDSLPLTFGSAVKAELTAREFAVAFGSSLVPSAHLALLVVPRLTDDDVEFAERELSIGEIEQVLTANCFTPLDEFWLVPWLIPHEADPHDLLTRSQQHITEVASRVRAVEVRHGVRRPFAELVHGMHRVLEVQL